ncbi:MAG: 5-formyltetrahydrofolate cyclo-ligase [Cellulophaga sp.]
MLKKELRLKYIALRNSLSSSDLSSLSIAIANKIIHLPVWEFNYFHLFLSIKDKKEIDTDYILSILQGRDKNVIIPKITSNSNLINFLLTDNTVIKINSWGIPEPVDGIEVPANKIEVVFVPLLAFDTLGNRVGYGKGFYDNFLESCPENVIKIGLSFFEAEEKIDGIRTEDIPLDYCITPNKTYKF